MAKAQRWLRSDLTGSMRILILPDGKWKNEHAGGESIEFARLLGGVWTAGLALLLESPPGSLSPQCWDGESLLPWAQVQTGSKASPPLQEPKSLRPGQESSAEGPSFRASYSYLEDISHVHEKNPLDGFPKPKRKHHFSAR